MSLYIHLHQPKEKGIYIDFLPALKDTVLTPKHQNFINRKRLLEVDPFQGESLVWRP